MSAAVKDTLVLDLSRDDMLLACVFAIELRDALDSEVVALGRATCEDDLLL